MRMITLLYFLLIAGSSTAVADSGPPCVGNCAAVACGSHNVSGAFACRFVYGARTEPAARLSVQASCAEENLTCTHMTSKWWDWCFVGAPFGPTSEPFTAASSGALGGAIEVLKQKARDRG